mgnify:CR=1 FL=1
MASLDIHSITSVHCEKYLLFIFCSQLAHAIRMMLHYKEVEFEDKMYTQGDAPDFSREEWLKEKFTLGLDLPNVSSVSCSMLRFPITRIMCK